MEPWHIGILVVGIIVVFGIISAGSPTVHDPFDDGYRPGQPIQPQERKEKDPNDTLFTRGNSTKWELEDYCPACNRAVGYKASVSRKCCEHCGKMYNWMSDFLERNRRSIFYQGKWQHQYRYKNDKMVFSEEPLGYEK